MATDKTPQPRILMLGWEYPPNFAGGLGIATKGIVDSLEKNAAIDLVLPFQKDRELPEEDLLQTADAYQSYQQPHTNQAISEAVRKRVEWLRKQRPTAPSHYGTDLMKQVEGFAAQVEGELHAQPKFDLIHAHDWMTFPAALKAKAKSKKPLILHIHSLETDRCANPQVDNVVARLEKHAVNQADAIFAVSDYTKQALITNYGADESKITVIHNGTPEFAQWDKGEKQSEKDRVEGLAPTASIDSELRAQPQTQQPAPGAKLTALPLEQSPETADQDLQTAYQWPWKLPAVAKNIPPPAEPEWMKPYNPKKIAKKQILFLGRITQQKGPLTFIRTAKRLLEDASDLSFIVAGLGDQLEDMMQLAEDEKIASYIDFKGFVGRSAVRKLLEEVEVLFMPSVSEPFGLVALEAAAMGIPVVASKQSGVMEVLPGVLTAEHWDSKQFARHLRMILNYKDLRIGLSRANKAAVKQITWDNAAKKIAFHYKSLLEERS